jgi:hypothetical protein
MSYSDGDYALTFCPFKKDKCGNTSAVEFTNEVNETSEVELSNLADGDTCSYKVKSSCNAPGFRVTDETGMGDSEVEVSFVEYEKRYMTNGTADTYSNSETKQGRKSKQPSDDKPPRDSSFGSMGKSNTSNCTTIWNVDGSTNMTAYQELNNCTHVLEANGTYTVTICYKSQRKPKRQHRNGTEEGESDMGNETKAKRMNNSTNTSGTGMSGGPGGESKNGRGGKSKENTETGPSGNKSRGNKTNKQESNDEWGQKWDNMTSDGYDEDDTIATVGYGQPSDGNYSQDMGGFRTFGTEGQGDDKVGLKEDYSETCSDRVMLVTVSAQTDTVAAAAAASSSSRGFPSVRSSFGHPVVMTTSGSRMVIEFGNYEFLSDLQTYEELAAESGITLKASMVIASLFSLLAMN